MNQQPLPEAALHINKVDVGQAGRNFIQGVPVAIFYRGWYDSRGEP